MQCLRRTDSLGGWQTTEGPCSVEGCGKPWHTKGLCKRHYERQRTTGTTDLKPKQDPGCKVDGCNGKHRAHGWCYAHYMRWYRKGSTDRTYLPGHESVTSHGYRKVTAHGHPLANGKGQVYVHRLALFDAIGPGDHPCHWCATTVRWEWTDQTDMLNVDHLDEDKGNNHPTNLVPSCGTCNRVRSRYPEWFAANVGNVAAGPAIHPHA